MNKDRVAFYLFSLVMSFVMSGAMSFTMTLINSGLAGIPAAWSSAWIISFCVALPLSIVVVPVSRVIVSKVVGGLDQPRSGVDINI